ncbi:MAG: hypothetical protein D3917_03870 [Candidatus Electrothrix sp. AX5]|nr:hypothetical protein [Candidatus Electrothrix sp. AX5]
MKEYVVAIIGVVGLIVPVLISIWYKERTKNQEPDKGTDSSQPNFSQTLSDVLALAEMQSRRDGKEVTSTHYFFSAALYLCPDEIKGFLVELEKYGAMPPPTPVEIAREPRTLQMERPFSTCIRSSLEELEPKISASSPLTVSDLFVDVAKFGKGSSVVNLRVAGVSADKIDELISKCNISVPHRR